jgi:hypothetical protein
MLGPIQDISVFYGWGLPFFPVFPQALLAGPNLERIRALFQRYSRDGILHISLLGLNTLLIGDLQTLKYVFSHPDVQNRGQ